MWIKNINTLLMTTLILIAVIKLMRENSLYNLLWLIMVLIYSISISILAERWNNKNE